MIDPLSHGDDAHRLHARLAAEHPAEYDDWSKRRSSMVVYVLGMHRSGTSCLMTCLEQFGVHVGDAERLSPHQPLGNIELLAARALNDELLAEAGGSWADPPPTVTVSEQQTAAIGRIVDELEANAPSAVKDPRLLFTLGPWMDATSTPTLVGTFRHPIDVAASLRERQGTPAERAVDLWCRYNERLVELHRVHGFPLVEFDLSDRERYCDVVAATAAELGLAPSRRLLHHVVERQRRRAPSGSESEVPAPCRDLYEYLRAHRQDPEVEPGSIAETLLSLGEARRAVPALGADRVVARALWRTTGRLPGPLRSAARPVRRIVLSTLRRRSATSVRNRRYGPRA